MWRRRVSKLLQLRVFFFFFLATFLKIQSEGCSVTSCNLFLLFLYLLPAWALQSANVNRTSRLICVHVYITPRAAVRCSAVVVFISLFLPSSAESALCVVALDPDLNHVRRTKRNCEKCDEVAFRAQKHHMKVFFFFFFPSAIMTTFVSAEASRMCFEKEKQIFNTKAEREKGQKKLIKHLVHSLCTKAETRCCTESGSTVRSWI